MYEEGMHASVETALRLEEILGSELLEPIDPFDAVESEEPEAEETAAAAVEALAGFGRLETEVFRLLQSVGFQVVPTGKSPFTALSREPRNLILTGINEEDRAARRKARIMRSVSQVTERDGVFVVRRETVRTEIEGTPLVSRKELQKMRDPDELQRLIEERRRRPASSE
jgi:putative transcriptional regulator